MTTLAVGIVDEVVMAPEGLFLSITLAVTDTRTDIDFGPIVPGTHITTQLNDIAAFLKAQATAQFGVVFGPTDTVQVFYPNDFIN